MKTLNSENTLFGILVYIEVSDFDIEELNEISYMCDSDWTLNTN